MPIKQMVLFRWKQNLPEERRRYHVEQVKSFPRKVDGMIEVLEGPRLISWPENWDHGFIITWGDLQRRDAWGTHPEHDRTAPGLIADTEAIVSFDFEC